VNAKSKVVAVMMLVCVFLPGQLYAERFLSFPLGNSFINVFHGWYHNDNWYHGGIDYRAAIGTPVFAAADGIAMSSNQPPNVNMDTYGTFVLLKHANGFLSCRCSTSWPGLRLPTFHIHNKRACKH